MAFEYFSQLTVVVPLSLLVVYLVYTKLTSKPLIPEHVPWVGRRSEIFSRSRANIRSFTRGRELLDDAYYKVLTFSISNAKLRIANSILVLETGPQLRPPDVPGRCSPYPSVADTVAPFPARPRSEHKRSSPRQPRGRLHDFE